MNLTRSPNTGLSCLLQQDQTDGSLKAPLEAERSINSTNRHELQRWEDETELPLFPLTVCAQLLACVLCVHVL